MLNRRFAQAFLIISTLVFVSFTFSPSISTAVWHVQHHGNLDYAGARFQVPHGWSARISPPAVHFEKRPATVFSREILVAWGAAAPVTHPPGSVRELDQDYANFAALYSTKLAAADEIEEESIRIGTGDRESFCKQSVLKSRPDWYRTTCLIWQATWRASFEGGPKEKEQFFALVLGLPDPRPTNRGASARP